MGEGGWGPSPPGRPGEVINSPIYIVGPGVPLGDLSVLSKGLTVMSVWFDVTGKRLVYICDAVRPQPVQPFRIKPGRA